MKLVHLLVFLTVYASLGSCGTVGGAVQGFGNDLIDVMRLSYKVI